MSILFATLHGRSKVRWAMTIAGVCITALSAPTVSAAPGPDADAQDGALDDVTVVAQRREQSAQDVPMAVAVLSLNDVAAAGVVDTRSLGAAVPSLIVTNQAGNVFPRIRGVGNNVSGPGFENGVATYVDGVYLAAIPATILGLSDVERIEVLKGPQGTLFGRNATGGLIHLITRQPKQDFGGELGLTYGNYDTLALDGYVTGGLTDGVAASLAGHYLEQGSGYGRNVTTGRDVYRTDEETAVRGAVVFEGFEATRVKLSGDYARTEGSMFARRPAPGTLPAFPTTALTSSWDVANDLQPLNSFEGWGVSAHVEHDFGAASLLSITAFRDSRNESRIDADSTSTVGSNTLLDQSDEQFTQEFQLRSNAGGRFSWIAGAFYLKSDNRFDPARIEFFGRAAPPFPAGPFAGRPIAAQIINAQLETKSTSGFAEGTWALSAETNLTAGVRYTSETRSVAAQTAVNLAGGPNGVALPDVARKEKSFSEPTWRLSIDHQIAPDRMIYASYNRGFKSGGFNGAAASADAFLPERLDAFEIGLKAEFLERTTRLNLAAYYYDYKDIQVSRFLPGLTVIYNGAAAEVYGLDADLTVKVSPTFTVNAGLSLIADEFTDFPNAAFFVQSPMGGNSLVIGDASGNELPQTSPITANLTLDKRVTLPSGQLALSLNYSYNDGYFTQPDNILFQGSYGLLNASATLIHRKGFEIGIWGRNLSDEAVTATLVASNPGSSAGYMPPRTYGVSFRLKR